MPSINFILPDGTKQTVEAKAGQSILEVAQQAGLDMEGACEASMACSTCHVIVAAVDYERLPEPSVEEEDMLDLTAGVTMTSRLGCQIIVTPEIDGLTLRLPPETRNMLGL